ncbi:MAG: hypothetical protein EP298_00065 [Gammaproteobacteria bacterium]|nr:MAG: hypothetical protein EP298_00065 [Gammaproteobacteria bacterium]UTW41587.1 hypothetical protein KFE69_08710 [bacterium SCSIO 12844]
MNLYFYFKNYFLKHAKFDDQNLSNKVLGDKQIKDCTILDFQKEVQAFFHKFGLGSTKMNKIIDFPSDAMKALQNKRLTLENLVKLGILEDKELKQFRDDKYQTWGDSLATYFPNRSLVLNLFYDGFKDSEKSVSENIRENFITQDNSRI